MKTEIEVPSDLSEISLDRYQKYLKTLKNSDDVEFVSQKMIEIFCGVELKSVVKMKASTVVELVQHFNKLFSEKPKFKHRFKLNDVEFGFITDLENISWGEYIDIEANIIDFETMHQALAVMYRPITKQSKDKYEIEPYNGDLTYAEVMKYAPLDVVLPASVFFLEFRERVIKQYSDLFGAEEEQNPYSESVQFGKRWGWYQSIYQLAKGDITKFDAVTEQGLFKALTLLTFEKQKASIEVKQLKKSHERIL